MRSDRNRARRKREIWKVGRHRFRVASVAAIASVFVLRFRKMALAPVVLKPARVRLVVRICGAGISSACDETRRKDFWGRHVS